MSLSHANYASDDEIMQTGQTVKSWRQKLSKKLHESSKFNMTQPNKYSGYVYDAVWLYALSLDRLIKQNQSYIQDIHSARSIQKFVEIIRTTDFDGVSGKIKFVNGNSRRSNIKVSLFCFLEFSRFFLNEYDLFSRLCTANLLFIITYDKLGKHLHTFPKFGT